ncbi:MAG: hypothetical protein ABR964_08055 [Tepidisphaeraceae bacterium]|jgi:hypothetical protein
MSTFAKLLSLLTALALSSTAPATQPADVQLRQWITQLRDDDPQVRDSACQSLMGLSRQDLPALRQAALALRPLWPNQLSALRDIVRQLYLAPQPPGPDDPPSPGFLGIFWPLGPAVSPQGLMVGRRIPGFVAYRMLRSGDVIVKILDQPDLPLTQPGQFTHAVQSRHAGRILPLAVLRSGRIIHLFIVLDPLPPGLGLDVENWMGARDKEADEYWNAHFAALEPGSAASQP